ncbi:hypothetical protein [Ornithinimicrobium sp. CNJ-824]|uniref:hypothetical protein n=1 Tax=Ornithinimicrobium sp. CNJ-824 TaxID=1904966 RepID=UPI001ED9D0E1|nr:hypothetical protein [Ornithinimicrobium sp. CNJ-824]
MPEELVAAFEAETGWDLTIQSSGDAGELTNRLVLTAGSPIGDVVFGIDNTYGTRASTRACWRHTPPPACRSRRRSTRCRGVRHT